MIIAADLIKPHHHIVIVQRGMLVQQDMPRNGVHRMIVYQPNILRHVLHHLASTEDLPAVAETFTDNRTTHTSIMTEWTYHRIAGRGSRITILQNTPLQPALTTTWITDRDNVVTPWLPTTRHYSDAVQALITGVSPLTTTRTIITDLSSTAWIIRVVHVMSTWIVAPIVRETSVS